MQIPFAEVAREVHMPENEMIDIVHGGIFAGVLDQRLGKRDVEGVGGVRLARLAAPPMAETHRPVGMQQPRKEPAQRPRTKYGVEQFEHRLSVDLHVVAVGDKEMFAVQAEPLRRSVDFDAAFAGEVVADPHIMVSGKKDDPHAPVGQLGQLAQRPHEALRHDLAVFEPEVEKVSDQKYRLRILRRIVEPSHETAFGFPSERLTACAQMDVGCEIMVHKSF